LQNVRCSCRISEHATEIQAGSLAERFMQPRPA
jgi:hypothetical protein